MNHHESGNSCQRDYSRIGIFATRSRIADIKLYCVLIIKITKNDYMFTQTDVEVLFADKLFKLIHLQNNMY